MAALRGSGVLDVVRGHEGDHIYYFAKDRSDKVVARSADVRGDAEGVTISKTARDLGLAVPVLQIGLSSQRGEGEGPGVPNGRIGPYSIEGGNEERVGVGRTVCKTDQQTTCLCLNDPLSPTIPFRKKGEVEEFEEVGEFGDDEDVVGKDLSRVGKGLNSNKEAPDPIDQSLESDLVDVRGRHETPEKDA